MIKADIVRQLAKYLQLKDKDALKIVDEILESMKDVIAAHGRLEIRDFGVFQIKERKPRIGRNPKNKVEYPIPPRKVVTFKPGKELKAHSALDKKPPDSRPADVPRESPEPASGPPSPENM